MLLQHELQHQYATILFYPCDYNYDRDLLMMELYPLVHSKSHKLQVILLWHK